MVNASVASTDLPFALASPLIIQQIELWAIRQTYLSWNLEDKYINLEGGSTLVTNWLTTCDILTSDIFDLVLDCRFLMERDWTMHPHHKYREANECASLMAKKVDTRASECKVMINTILFYDQYHPFVY